MAVYGAVRISCGLTNLALTPSTAPPDLGLENALIVVARIGLRSPTKTGERFLPKILSLILSNGFARVHEIFYSEVPAGTRTPSGYVPLGGQKTTPLNMRREILERLGTKNVLVGFHVGWILTAIELVLPASRVIDLGIEENFQRFSQDLAGKRPGWKDVLIEHLALSYDPPLPAVLSRGHQALPDRQSRHVLRGRLLRRPV